MVEPGFPGLAESLALTRDSIHTLPSERLNLDEAVGRVLAEDVRSLVDSPSVHGSLKDGYAVVSEDIRTATAKAPVTLRLAGSVAAGEHSGLVVSRGSAIRVLTGARVPEGSDAVVAEEFVRVGDGLIVVSADAGPGRNILPKGSDVALGGLVAPRGTVISPGLLGLLAAAGHSRLEVIRRPRVVLIATGDEVVAPGSLLPEGKLYASNIVTLAGWCRLYGFSTSSRIVADERQALAEALGEALVSADAVITSGGAWTGDRDLVAEVLKGLGWKKLFHRLRIGPGKAVGFGLLAEKPIFILPGGPPSNLMGFLQIALPGLLRLSGSPQAGLPTRQVVLAEELTTRFPDWTQFFFGTLERVEEGGLPTFRPLAGRSRLGSMAEAGAIVRIPEGESRLGQGETVDAQLLDFR